MEENWKKTGRKLYYSKLEEEQNFYIQENHLKKQETNVLLY